MFKMMKNIYELQELQKEIAEKQLEEIEHTTRLRTRYELDRINEAKRKADKEEEIKRKDDIHWQNLELRAAHNERNVEINELIAKNTKFGREVNEHLDRVLTLIELKLKPLQKL